MTLLYFVLIALYLLLDTLIDKCYFRIWIISLNQGLTKPKKESWLAILSLAQLSPSLFPNIFRIEGQNHNLSYNYNLFKFDRLSLATGRDTFCCSFCSWWWPGRKNTTTTTPVLLNLSDVLNQRSAAVIIIIPPLINRIYYASSNYHCTTKQKHTHTHIRKRTHTHKHTHIYRQTNKTNTHTYSPYTN